MHQSVYDKALAIFHEGTKKLELMTKAIDRERIQSSVEHKLEERKVKQDLLTMIKDKNRIDSEPRGLNALEKGLLRRENTFSGMEAFKRRKQLRLQKGLSTLPQLTCTTANVPKIMRRNLSNESEFHNWLTGLPKIGKPSFSLSSRPVTKETTKPLPEGTQTSDSKEEEKRRISKVSNIVYNVPLFSKEERKLIRENSFQSFDQKNNSISKQETRLPSIKSREGRWNINTHNAQGGGKKRPKTQYSLQKPKI